MMTSWCIYHSSYRFVLQ